MSWLVILSHQKTAKRNSNVSLRLFVELIGMLVAICPFKNLDILLSPTSLRTLRLNIFTIISNKILF